MALTTFAKIELDFFTVRLRVRDSNSNFSPVILPFKKHVRISKVVDLKKEGKFVIKAEIKTSDLCANPSALLAKRLRNEC